MSALTITETLVVETCWCGIHHAIPRSLQRQAYDHGTAVHCPLGHTWIVTQSKVDELEHRLTDERARVARVVAELDQERAELRTTRGQLTKARKRTAGGACPCCNRSFVQLARHMATKHPDLATATS